MTPLLLQRQPIIKEDFYRHSRLFRAVFREARGHGRRYTTTGGPTSMIRQAVGVGTTYQEPTVKRASRLWWPGVCLLLEGMLENWVRDAMLDPTAYSDITDRSTVSTARRKALTQFALAVQDPYSCWLIMDVAAVTRTTPPAILEALLDRVGLPHDYQYTPAVVPVAIAA